MQNIGIIENNGVRILRPWEFAAVREEAARGDKERALQLDALTFTGMRYIEMERFHAHPEWFNGGYLIHLPKEAIKKVKIKQRSRYVRLNELGRKAVIKFLAGGQLPGRKGWDGLMRAWGRRAGIGEEAMCSKTTRKTWESWLVYFDRKGKNWPFIMSSQGHTSETSLGHYATFPFVGKDQVEMAPYVRGWPEDSMR